MQTSVTTSPALGRSQGAIVLLLDSSGRGGIESHVLLLAKGLQQQGKDVAVVLLNRRPGNPLCDSLSQAGIRCLRLSNAGTALYRLLRELRPSLLHTHGYKAGISGRLWARLLNLSCISTFHAGEPGTGRVRLYRYLDHASALLAHSIAVSAKIKAELPKRCQLIPNFVEVPPAYSRATKVADLQVAFVGRLSAEKGPQHFAQLAHFNLHLNFHCYGSGPLEDSLKRSKAVLDTQNLHYHGDVQMAQHWRNIGLLCICSDFEGLPLAALEAMAQGIPVLAFAVGDLPALIEDGINGWLIKPGDIGAMQQAIEHWANLGRDEYQSMATAARARIVANYGLERGLQSTLTMYRQAGYQHA